MSVMTVEPVMVDPDYTYVKISANVVYDTKKTTATANQISQQVTTAINNFATSTLNTFNSTFSASQLVTAVQYVDNSIVTNDYSIQLQKKFYPQLGTSASYNLYYGTSLKKGLFSSSIQSSPSIQTYNSTGQLIDGVYFEEVPSSSGGVDSISVINTGYGYQTPPTVKILGDGTTVRISNCTGISSCA